VVDRDWLAELAANVGNIVCFDNHYSVGGQADRVARVMADEDIHARFLSIGLDTIPACGTNDEVLLAHGFATDEVAQKVVGWLR
jgi:transketolase